MLTINSHYTNNSHLYYLRLIIDRAVSKLMDLINRRGYQQKEQAGRSESEDLGADPPEPEWHSLSRGGGGNVRSWRQGVSKSCSPRMAKKPLADSCPGLKPLKLNGEVGPEHNKKVLPKPDKHRIFATRASCV